jgi:hypothetical protein
MCSRQDPRKFDAGQHGFDDNGFVPGIDCIAEIGAQSVSGILNRYSRRAASPDAASDLPQGRGRWRDTLQHSENTPAFQER